MLEHYWSDEETEKATEEKGLIIRTALDHMAETYGQGNFSVVGNGMLAGLNVTSGSLATAIADEAFSRRLIVETCGTGDATVKLLAPIVIEEDELHTGLQLLEASVAAACIAR